MSSSPQKSGSADYAISFLADHLGKRLVEFVAANILSDIRRIYDSLKSSLLNEIGASSPLLLGRNETRERLGSFLAMIPAYKDIVRNLPEGADSVDGDELFVVRGSLRVTDDGPRIAVVIPVNFFLAATIRSVLIECRAWEGFSVQHHVRTPGSSATSSSASLASSPGSASTSTSAAVWQK